MKKIWILIIAGLLLAALSFSACCDDDDLQPCSETGIIIGIDYRECGCCGGYFIEINEDTLRAPTLPEPFVNSFDPAEIPLPIYLEWHEQDPQCLGDEIVIDCIARQQGQ